MTGPIENIIHKNFDKITELQREAVWHYWPDVDVGQSVVQAERIDQHCGVLT